MDFQRGEGAVMLRKRKRQFYEDVMIYGYRDRFVSFSIRD